MYFLHATALGSSHITPVYQSTDSTMAEHASEKEKFAHRVNKIPGLEKVNAVEELSKVNINTESDMGRLTIEQWKEACSKLKQKTTTSLDDGLGPGHLQSLDTLHADIVKETRRRLPTVCESDQYSTIATAGGSEHSVGSEQSVE